MSVTLDGQSFFDSQQLSIELSSFRRDFMERAVAGLDGVLSIDLGGRSREVKQKGVLRAKSRLQMDEKIGAISACMDGGVHVLVTDEGGTVENLRIDVFKISKERASGSGIVVDYEIIYTQLVV